MNDSRLSYRILQLWARAAVSVFYRRTDVTGAERVAVDRPVVLASNHANALADIAVIVAKVPRFPHFLASATWWKSKPARLLFRLGGVLPIHRRRDSDTAQNVSTFAACNAALAEGAHLCIFPEGEMHDEPALLPLRTGAARIALGAAAEGNADVTIVPVGLVYEDRGRFRSRAEVHFGEPVEVRAWVDAFHTDPAKAAREVTDVLADRLARATVNHGTHAEARLLDLAAAVVLADVHAGTAEPASYRQRNELRRALADAVAVSGGETGATYRALEVTIEAHVAAMQRLGVHGDAIEIDLEAPPPGVRARLRLRLALLAPGAALGTAANAPTLLLLGAASRLVRNDGWQATIKGLGGTLLSPVVWAIEYALLSKRRGRAWALATTATGALCGRVALTWHEDRRRRHQLAWHARTSARRPWNLDDARTTRRAVRAEVERVLARSVAER